MLGAPVQSINIPTKNFVKLRRPCHSLIYGLSCIYTLRQNKLEQQNAHPPEIKYESKPKGQNNHAIFLFVDLLGGGGRGV